MEILLTSSISWHHNWVFQFLAEMWKELRMKFVYIFYQCLSKLLFSSLQPFSVADKFSWEEPQFITAIHDGGDGLILCEWHSQGYNLTHSCHVCSSLAKTVTTITLKMFVWSFLCNLIGITVMRSLIVVLQVNVIRWLGALWRNWYGQLLQVRQNPEGRTVTWKV
jgi:hypothetical protein